MLSVHKLPLTHEILADHDEAKAAREVGIMEALVMIDRGLIVSVNTPPCGLDEFGSDEDWIANAIRDAFERGLSTGREWPDAEATWKVASGDPEQFAPEGWTLWENLIPGTVATSGDDSDTPYLLLGGAGCFRALAGGTYNAARLGVRRQPWTFQHNPATPPPWPFYRVLRTGLSGEQLHHLAAAVEAGEDVEMALARLVSV